MKESPRDKDLTKNFEPSRFSGGGFLGDDDRSVAEIIAADGRVLDELGITPDMVAGALESAFEKGVQAQGGEREVAPGVYAVYFEARGRIPSPFRGEGTFEKGEVVLTGKESGIQIIITRLSIHLIRKHGFFQGRGARYRIDPKTAVEILGPDFPI